MKRHLEISDIVHDYYLDTLMGHSVGDAPSISFQKGLECMEKMAEKAFCEVCKSKNKTKCSMSCKKLTDFYNALYPMIETDEL